MKKATANRPVKRNIDPESAQYRAAKFLCVRNCWRAKLVAVGLACVCCGLLTPHTSAQTYSFVVSTTNPTLPISGGEVQSTVVGPHLKAGCPVGRLLVTNDFARPPKAGTVTGHDLGAHPSPDIQSTFDAIPGDPNDYSFQTNDHEIVTFSNGDVLLIFGVHIKKPVTPKPAWFDTSYKGNFGPGTRRGMATWKSTDCGATFQYVSLIDPATFGDGSCAFSQIAQGEPKTTFPGSPSNPVYSSGGVDGQLDVVVQDKLYTMFGCWGNKPNLPLTQPFSLSPEKVNETFVLRSDDEGANLKVLGTVPSNGWRPGIVPVNPSVLAFAYSNKLMWANLVNGNWTSLANANVAPNSTWGYDATSFNQNPNTPIKGNTQAPVALIYVNLYAATVSTRVPGSTNPLIAFPETIPDSQSAKSHGFRMFFYDRTINAYAEGDPILPRVHTTDNSIMHMNTIDTGTGPVLLYWTDVDGKNKTASVRGRFILGEGNWDGDFAISVTPVAGKKPASIRRSFKLDQGNGLYWYGDYQTAGGFKQTLKSGVVQWQYFPIWIEPDNKVHYAQIAFRLQGKLPGYHKAAGKPKQALVWKPSRSVNVAEIVKSPAEKAFLEDGLPEH